MVLSTDCSRAATSAASASLWNNEVSSTSPVAVECGTNAEGPYFGLEEGGEAVGEGVGDGPAVHRLQPRLLPVQRREALPLSSGPVPEP